MIRKLKRIAHAWGSLSRSRQKRVTEPKNQLSSSVADFTVVEEIRQRNYWGDIDLEVRGLSYLTITPPEGVVAWWQFTFLEAWYTSRNVTPSSILSDMRNDLNWMAWIWKGRGERGGGVRKPSEKYASLWSEPVDLDRGIEWDVALYHSKESRACPATQPVTTPIEKFRLERAENEIKFPDFNFGFRLYTSSLKSPSPLPSLACVARVETRSFLACIYWYAFWQPRMWYQIYARPVSLACSDVLLMLIAIRSPEYDYCCGQKIDRNARKSNNRP